MPPKQKTNRDQRRHYWVAYLIRNSNAVIFFAGHQKRDFIHMGRIFMISSSALSCVPGSEGRSTAVECGGALIGTDNEFRKEFVGE